MGYKTIILMAAAFSAAYPPLRDREVAAVCRAVPSKTVAEARSMIPVPASTWAWIDRVAAGDFGAPPTAAPFRRVWDLEKDAAAWLADYASSGQASTLAGVCGTPPDADGGGAAAGG